LVRMVAATCWYGGMGADAALIPKE
jgi:hypothetical protein